MERRQVPFSEEVREKEPVIGMEEGELGLKVIA